MALHVPNIKKRGLATSAGVGAVHKMLETELGIKLDIHFSDKHYIVRRGKKPAVTIRVYSIEDDKPPTWEVSGFGNEHMPDYYMFVHGLLSVSWVVARDDLWKYYSGKKKCPEHMIPKKKERVGEDTGCMKLYFRGGEPEQLNRPAQLGL